MGKKIKKKEPILTQHIEMDKIILISALQNDKIHSSNKQ